MTHQRVAQQRGQHVGELLVDNHRGRGEGAIVGEVDHAEADDLLAGTDQRRRAQHPSPADVAVDEPGGLELIVGATLSAQEGVDARHVTGPREAQGHARTAGKGVGAGQQGAGIKAVDHFLQVSSFGGAQETLHPPPVPLSGRRRPAPIVIPAPGTVVAVDEQLTLGGSSQPTQPAPLAERMRPRTLDEVVGQPQLTAPDSPLRVALASGAPHSMVLWGPPGTGKTTIALCVAAVVDAEVEQLNAVTDGIKELRAVIARAEQRRATGGRTLLFIDEIARWNKAQQDALLPYVENGTVVLVGSTTENPGFELNRALVSRLQVHVVAAPRRRGAGRIGQPCAGRRRARRRHSGRRRPAAVRAAALARSSTCC